MLFVEIKDLKPGMRLAKPIYNRMGVMLYDRNSYLTSSGIKSIENFGLIGLFILEPAEPLPPLSPEDLEFEQLQVVYMFRVKEIMDRLQREKEPESLSALAADILKHYGSLDHKLNFVQTLRGSADFVYKHTASTAILSALIANAMKASAKEKHNLVTAALLYDIGYLYVPKRILDKRDIDENDQIVINECRKKGLQLLHPDINKYDLPDGALTIIQQTHAMLASQDPKTRKGKNIYKTSHVLTVADKFDRLTAMSVNHAPLSEVAAMNELRNLQELYQPKVISALAECIHILPNGCSIDLSNGDKGIVLVENPVNFHAPVVLNIRDNMIYDLSDPKIASGLHIVDIMKTMDNRIVIDEETFSQFSSDPISSHALARYQKQSSS